jgi:hypothetical protein
MSSISLKSTKFKGALHLASENVADTPTAIFSITQVGDGRTASQTGTNGMLSYSTAMVVNQVLIGCPYLSHSGKTEAGAAFLFKKIDGEWVEEKAFYPTDPQDSGHFGFSVGIGGSVIAIGAPGEDSQRGAVYTYFFEARRNINDWLPCLNARIVPQDYGIEMDGRFGHSVHLSNYLLVVGSPNAHGGGGLARYGSAYTYDYHLYSQRWEFKQKLVPTLGKDGSGFGAAVSQTGDNTIAVGAPLENVAYGGDVSQAGAVYVFSRNASWSQKARLIAPVGQENGHFGHAISLASDAMVIGAPGFSGGGAAFRSAGVWDQWSSPVEITARASGGTYEDSSVLDGDGQGWSVAQDVTNSVIYIGSPGREAIYVYEISHGIIIPSLTPKITPSTPQGIGFGSSISAFAGEMIAGAPEGNDGGFWFAFKK